ncbi:hypothetical protein ACQZV8_14010 [Magnetococcales bacterium HHB-1]
MSLYSPARPMHIEEDVDLMQLLSENARKIIGFLVVLFIGGYFFWGSPSTVSGEMEKQITTQTQERSTSTLRYERLYVPALEVE